jgi:integrase
MNDRAALATTGGLRLPNSIRTRSGATLDPHQPRWSFHDGVDTISLNFSSLKWAAPKLIECLKFPLAWYAENRSAGQLEAHFYGIQRLVEFLGCLHGEEIIEISATGLINYRASLRSDTEWQLGALAAFLKKWHALQMPGISNDAITFLKQVRLKGVRKGTAVLTMDPVDGPFSEVELQAVYAALNEAYSAGDIVLGDYVLVWLFMLLGQRPRQFALLKVCDVVPVTKKDASLEYVLRVPRVKQGMARHRDEFKDRLLAPSIGRLLCIYADGVKKLFGDKLPDPSQAPLFPAGSAPDGQPDYLKFHLTSTRLGLRLVTVLDGLEVWSERTGQALHITATRFRRTLGTRAAKEGHGELIIAELLDHSDTQNVGVYVRATPEIVERIDRAIALQMAPLARAFSGVIISNESEAVRGDDPTSRIVDPRFDKDLAPMGNCGTSGSCDFMAPISCYTCKSFQAWADGPHEAVLLYLIAERERLMHDTDGRIAAINDRTILAVAEVVRQCHTNSAVGGA